MVSDAWSESPTRRCCGVDRRPIQRTATRARANQPVWRARGRRARLYEPVAALWAINGAGSAFVSPEAGDNRDKLRNHLKAHSYVIFNDPDDGVDYISAAEVLEVEYKGSDDETMVVWAVIHQFSLETSYKHNMPMVEQQLSSEYVDSREKSWVAPNKAKLAGLEMNRYRHGHEDC